MFKNYWSKSLYFQLPLLQANAKLKNIAKKVDTMTNIKLLIMKYKKDPSFLKILHYSCNPTMTLY